MKHFLALICLLSTALMVPAQALLYKDVAVIVNDSSQSSLTIGNYFAQQRGITPNRVLHVSAPTTGEIDSLQFENLRAQIEAALIGGNLLDSVGFLVTTKGMPSAISIRNGCDSADYVFTQAFERCTSVESEISLILGPYSSGILVRNPVYSPYVNSGQAFVRDSFGIFLVSRLDGFTDADALGLIDHGGPDRSLLVSDAEIVLDHCFLWPGSQQLAGFFDTYVPSIETEMSALGYGVTRDVNPTSYVQNVTNVLAYVAAFGPDSTATFDPNFDFLPGSLANLWLDNSPISTVDPMLYTAGDAIRDGAAVVASGVGLAYFSTGFQANAFLPIYADTAAGRRFYAAEAYYLSTNGLSQAQMMYGDPKTSLQPTLIMSTPEPDALAFAMSPNPSDGRFRVRMAADARELNLLQVMDLEGRVLMESRHKAATAIEVDATDLAAGLYIVRMSNDKTAFSRKLSIVR